VGFHLASSAPWFLARIGSGRGAPVLPA
jgi:hypothetical protein